MIQMLVPDGACAEMFSDAPESTMFAIEAAVVANAVDQRRREFATVRYCARKALLQIGTPAVPILPAGDGSPRWPAGVVGSMTHCAGYRAAAVARATELSSVGIDAEPHAAVPDEALDMILRDEERAGLVALTDAYPYLHWDRILFCAKEAVYKAWFPLTRQWLDFTDVSTTVNPDGTFGAYVHFRWPRAAAGAEGFSGRWVVGRGLVVAATAVGRTPATEVPTTSSRALRSAHLGGSGLRRPVGPSERHEPTAAALVSGIWRSSRSAPLARRERQPGQ
jgi:4'-phosphopantetheinyl transferase EntD